MGLFDYIRGLFGGGDDEGGSTTRAAGSAGGSADAVDEEKYQGIGEMHDEIAAGDEREAPSDAESEASEEDAPDVESTMADGSAGADQLADGDGEDEALEPPESFREEAQELVDFWPEHDLDFTPESLVRLDEFVDGQWEKDRFTGIEDLGDGEGVHVDQLAFQGIVVQLGSYFGETLVRTYDAAEWSETEDFGWVVAVDGDDGELLSNVFHIAKDCLREPSKFRLSHDNVVTHAGLDADLLDPDGGEGVTIAVSMPDEDTDPAEFREAAERLVEDYSWEALDYTPESLADLDRVVEEELFDGEALVDDFEEEELSETVRKLGSYLGETLVESHDAEWVYEDGAWSVDVTRNGEVVGVEVFQAAVSVLHEGITFTGIYERLAGDALTEMAGEDEESLQEMAATQAQVFAAENAGYDLDFSRDSLGRLDDLATEEYGELDALEEPTNELLQAAVPFSAYFGEVLRREFDANWVDQDGPVILLPTEDGEGVGVDALQAAATCLAGNGTFSETCEKLLAEQ